MQIMYANKAWTIGGLMRIYAVLGCVMASVGTHVAQLRGTRWVKADDLPGRGDPGRLNESLGTFEKFAWPIVKWHVVGLTNATPLRVRSLPLVVHSRPDISRWAQEPIAMWHRNRWLVRSDLGGSSWGKPAPQPYYKCHGRATEELWPDRALSAAPGRRGEPQQQPEPQRLPLFFFKFLFSFFFWYIWSVQLSCSCALSVNRYMYLGRFVRF